jgi:EAL domain-containing protein (putative c-di-GMP-specific phosphodiesterase class I)
MEPCADMSGFAAGEYRSPSLFGGAEGPTILLVCRDPSWDRAVRDATAGIGQCGTVSSVPAAVALRHLAALPDHYSHLLVEHNGDETLLDTLIQLTSNAAGSETEMLMLGGGIHRVPFVNVITAATSQSVREALMLNPPKRGQTGTDLQISEVRAALENSQISARYQPIVRLKDRGLAALEVLARLDHPVIGTVMPDRFVPQVEDAGLAEQLTELIAARAFADMTGPALSALKTPITINFPLSVLLRSEAIAVLEAQRIASGLPADQVVVELTESTPVEDFNALRKAVQYVRALGYRAAIDDVSPTVPGLQELLSIPFTSLKLDKDLFTGQFDDADTADFVRDTIRQAHEHDMQVIAEGIETVEMWRKVKALEVDAAQGFLIARPLPAAAVSIWLEGWQASSLLD